MIFCVRDVQGAQQSGLPDRAKAEPGAARPEGQRPAPVAFRETFPELVAFHTGAWQPCMNLQ